MYGNGFFLGMFILSSSLRGKPVFIKRIQPLVDFSSTNDFCSFKANQGYGILGAPDYNQVLKLSNAAVQRVNLNTEKANTMEVGSARRMKGNSAEIGILKPQYTDFLFMEVHLLMAFIVVFSFCQIIADDKMWDTFLIFH